MSKNPEKLILNPVHNTFKKIPMHYVDYPFLDFSYEIRWTRELVPIEIYSRNITDIHNINDYKINYLIKNIL